MSPLEYIYGRPQGLQEPSAGKHFTILKTSHPEQNDKAPQRASAAKDKTI